MTQECADNLTDDQSVPLPFSKTFSQYAQLGQRLRKHYVSPRVLLALVSGQFIPPIHRKNLYSLQYSMLPAKRVSVRELWTLLSSEANMLDGNTGMNGHANGFDSGIASVVVKRVTKKEKKYWWNT